MMPTATGVSDGEGRVTLEGLNAGRWKVMLGTAGVEGEMAGEEVEVSIAPGDDKAVTVACAPPVEVEGVVKDVETGAPVAGVLVEVMHQEDAAGGVGKLRTDAKGRFVARVGAGEFDLVAEDWDAEKRVVPHKTPGANGRMGLQVGWGRKGEVVELRVHRRPVVKGQLVDGSGKGVAGVVEAQMWWWATDGEGRFTIPCPEAFGGDEWIEAVDVGGTLGREMVIDPSKEARVVLERMGAMSGRFSGGLSSEGDVTVGLHVLVSGRAMASVPAGPGRIRVKADGTFVVGPLLTGMPTTVVMGRVGGMRRAVEEIGEPVAGVTQDVGEVKLPEQ
jgi:hypothetical protein